MSPALTESICNAYEKPLTYSWNPAALQPCLSRPSALHRGSLIRKLSVYLSRPISIFEILHLRYPFHSSPLQNLQKHGLYTKGFCYPVYGLETIRLLINASKNLSLDSVLPTNESWVYEDYIKKPWLMIRWHWRKYWRNIMMFWPKTQQTPCVTAHSRKS